MGKGRGECLGESGEDVERRGSISRWRERIDEKGGCTSCPGLVSERSAWLRGMMERKHLDRSQARLGLGVLSFAF